MTATSVRLTHVLLAYVFSLITPTRVAVPVTRTVTTQTPVQQESVKPTMRHRALDVLLMASSAQMMSVAQVVMRVLALIQMMTQTRAVVLATQIVTTLTAA